MFEVGWLGLESYSGYFPKTTYKRGGKTGDCLLGGDHRPGVISTDTPGLTIFIAMTHIVGESRPM